MAAQDSPAKPKAPKGCQVEARMVAAKDKVAFGFIYLDSGPRVGWSTQDGNVELWVANWGEPNAAGVRLAALAADYICDVLPWECTWGWRKDG